MENQLEITEEIQVVPEKYGIEISKANELLGNLPQIKAERSILEAQYAEVVLMDINSPDTLKKAKDLRILIRDNRTKGIQIWHKSTKDFFLKGGQFVDAIKNKEVAVNERMEATLDGIEKHFENLKIEAEKTLKSERETLLKPYVDDAALYPLGVMSEVQFNELLEGRKLAHEKKVADALAAENARIEKEKADAAEREKQRLENEQLRKEAEAREKEMVAERTRAAAEKAKQDAIIAAERKKQDDLLAAKNKQLVAEKAAKDKAEADAKALRDAETKRILKKEAEEKFEADRKKEADRRAAAAPDKEKLRVWINSIQMGDTPTLSGEPNAVLLLIDEKFQAFKTWANEQINTL